MIKNDFALKYLSDAQQAQLERNPAYRQKGQSCPVCEGKGSFVYENVEYECPNDEYGHVALRLAKLYWLHNIPLEYQQLVWDEWVPQTGAVDVKEDCDAYIERFNRYSLNGVGMTFYSKGLGTGKTWAATATLKRLVKSGIDGWFAPFYEVASYYQMDDVDERRFRIARIQDAAVLVLDDVKSPTTAAHKLFLAEKLENLIRPRSNANLPTIITTNMTPDEIEEAFPRAFSLMQAKNLTIELTGADSRLGNAVWKRNVESVANGWALPIT